jgi:hypothetical protein
MRKLGEPQAPRGILDTVIEMYVNLLAKKKYGRIFTILIGAVLFLPMYFIAVVSDLIVWIRRGG